MGIRLKISDLQPGMILAENLIDDEGTVIFPAGRKLNEEDILKLSNMPGINKFVVVEGEDVLRRILEEAEKKADEKLKSEVNKALSFCSLPNEELKRNLYLLGLRYRMLLAEKKGRTEE